MYVCMYVCVQIQLPGSTYWWQDKYRPRKPRYLNRVKTGWDWNKYNQTHYDFDNPPPKIIQGYKFTVFYPDLIDKTVLVGRTHRHIHIHAYRHTDEMISLHTWLYIYTMHEVFFVRTT